MIGRNQLTNTNHIQKKVTQSCRYLYYKIKRPRVFWRHGVFNKIGHSLASLFLASDCDYKVYES